MFAEAAEPPAAAPIPPDFAWTRAEREKVAAVARLLHCDEVTAGQVLVFFLRYILEHRRGLAVASLPEVLSGFPVKWGYKRKRNDFLRLLQDLEFLYVQINFRPKVRSKTYALGQAGLQLLGRLPPRDAAAGPHRS